jgi:hypothetical protein
MQRWLPVASLWLAWITFFFFGFAPALVTATDAIPPEKAMITLTPKFGPVTFAHQRHSDLEDVHCTTCHHMMSSRGQEVRSCYTCHEAVYFSIANIRKAGPDPEGDTEPRIRNAQEAFHGLCTDCHKRRRAQDLATGPDDSCRDCHK